MCWHVAQPRVALNQSYQPMALDKPTAARANAVTPWTERTVKLTFCIAVGTVLNVPACTATFARIASMDFTSSSKAATTEMT